MTRFSNKSSFETFSHWPCSHCFIIGQCPPNILSRDIIRRNACENSLSYTNRATCFLKFYLAKISSCCVQDVSIVEYSIKTVYISKLPGHWTPHETHLRHFNIHIYTHTYTHIYIKNIKKQRDMQIISFLKFLTGCDRSAAQISCPLMTYWTDYFHILYGSLFY